MGGHHGYRSIPQRPRFEVASQVLALADQWLDGDLIVEERTWNEIH